MTDTHTQPSPARTPAELQEMADVSARSAFLIEGDTVRASWLLGSELPDVDAAIAAASSLSR